MHDKQAPVACDGGRALRPVCFYPCKPLDNQMAEAAGRRVLHCSKLVAETCRTHDRDSTGNVDCPTFPGQPEIEVKNARRVGQRRDNFAFDRNSVFVNLAIEIPIQCNYVSLKLGVADRASGGCAVP